MASVLQTEAYGIERSLRSYAIKVPVFGTWVLGWNLHIHCFLVPRMAARIPITSANIDTRKTRGV